MPATFARSKTFVAGEVLTAADLNAVETNLLTNFTPAGMDDYSVDVAAMRITTDPYPASVESLATSLQGELERIRYILAQMTGNTYWYQDTTTASPTFAGLTLNGVLDVDPGTENETPFLQFGDIFSDYVVTGLLPATSLTLISDISAGKAYAMGKRIYNTVYSKTYTASKDTYVDVDYNGVYTFTEVLNGAAAPAIAANSIRLANVITDVDNITGVTDLRTLYNPCTAAGRALIDDATAAAQRETIGLGSVAFSAYNSVVQTIATATWTKVLFDTELFDTNSNFATSRFTPTIAGKYVLSSGLIYLTMVDLTQLYTAIYKNGIEAHSGVIAASGTIPQGGFVSAVVDANGSTDYFEIYVYQNSGASQNITAGVARRHFSGGRIL